MPVMAQPEAYLGHVTDDSFNESGCLKDGPLKDLVAKLAHAFHDWVEMIHRSRQLLAEDAAHASQKAKDTSEHLAEVEPSLNLRLKLPTEDRMELPWLSRWQPQLLANLRIVTGLLFLEHGLIKLAGFPPGGNAGCRTSAASSGSPD